MTRGATLALALAAALAPGRAAAQAGAPLGDPSAEAALAGAVTARPGDTGAVSRNPGALAGVDRPVLSLGAHAGELDLWFARTGEGGRDLGRTFAGVGGGLVARLPGPQWLRRVRLGFGVHLPTSHLLRLSAPPRPDRPEFVRYGDRIGRTAVTGALGVELPWGLGLGVGVTLTPSLDTTTRVGYDATRGDDPDDNVVVDADNTLRIEGAPLAGLRWEVTPELALGLAWRGEQAVSASGPNSTRAGALVVLTTVDFFEFFAPEEFAAGVYAAPFEQLALSADVAWARWSGFRTIHDRPATPGFDDVVNVRLGVEWVPRPWHRVRAGWALEPSPVPEQRAVSNFLDADRHVIGLGLGVDLEALGWAPMRIDVHVRWHVLGTRHDEKDPDALDDAHPDLPGHQIDNRGYPGFTAAGSVAQVGLTLTVPLAPRQEVP